jgi:ankyrin repeat protein
MTRPFPPNPSLSFDRKQAKSLLDSLRKSDPDALRRFVESHPDFANAPDPGKLASEMQLHDAQLVVAREYGLPSWRALVEKIVNIEIADFKHAVRQGDVNETRRLLGASPDLVEHINNPMFDFGGRAINQASANPAMVDVLLEFGADINLRSDWDKGPYSILDNCDEKAARHYIARGAKLTAHAAARLGWIDELRTIIDADANVVHERGGDGQQPLHFAKTIEIADLLLDRGAEIDARCLDHHSTPAQYAIDDRLEICRHLLARGAAPDIFLAARLGDNVLAERLIDGDASCLGARINADGYQPVPPFNIYCWKLGWYLSPHEVALKFNQPTTYELLWNRSPQKIRWMVACSRGDIATAKQILSQVPDLSRHLSCDEQSLLPKSMFHGRVDSVKLMLSLGFDPSAAGADGATLLHFASWHGDAQIVAVLLRDYRERIDVNAVDKEHHATPLGWTAHGSRFSFRKDQGDYPAVAKLLVDGGAKLNRSGPPTETQRETDERLQELLARTKP